MSPCSTLSYSPAISLVSVVFPETIFADQGQAGPGSFQDQLNVLQRGSLLPGYVNDRSIDLQATGPVALPADRASGFADRLFEKFVQAGQVEVIFIMPLIEVQAGADGSTAPALKIIDVLVNLHPATG